MTPTAHTEATSPAAQVLWDMSVDLLAVANQDGYFTSVSPSWTRMLGYTPEELTSRPYIEFVHPDDVAATLAAAAALREPGHVTVGFTCRYRSPSGAYRWLDWSVKSTADGRDLYAIARDVTDVRMAMEALAQENQFRLAMEFAATGMCLVSPEGRFLHANSALCGMLGYGEEELQSRTFQDLTHPEDLDVDLELVGDVLAGRRDSYHLRKRYITRAGGTLWGDLSVGAVRDADGSVRYFVSHIADVTEQKFSEAELLRLATHDPLTGLSNRTALVQEVGRALSAGRRSGKRTGVLLIDLDRFKFVNDSLGHGFGDSLLRAAAARLAISVRDGDLVARPGGDEFVVVMREMPDSADAVHAAWRIVDAFREPFQIEQSELFATVSVGVAVSSEESDADDLIREADTALYVAKEEGRDRMSVFNDDLRDEVAKRLSIEGDLRHALSRAEFEVWYQPEVDLSTGHVIAVEALVRWRHPSGEIYTAERFVLVAEETGLILDIGDWVFERACADAAHFARLNPDRALMVRVNLSALQLAEHHLLDAVDRAIEHSGVDPSRLCVEITETALLRETAAARRNLDGIRRRGIQIAADDFGTGYASLAYLLEYPIDVLKIDKSFVDGLVRGVHGKRLVAGIVALADAMRISVTAEGVETPEQAEALRALRCPAAQGFLFSAAVPAAEIDDLLERTFVVR